ncbi:MAG TPA: hypothetical protein VI756_15550, partial [Blastocatellia bacterium]
MSKNTLRRAAAALAFPVFMCALLPSIGFAGQQSLKRKLDVHGTPGVVSGRITIQGKPRKGLTVQAILTALDQAPDGVTDKTTDKSPNEAMPQRISETLADQTDADQTDADQTDAYQTGPTPTASTLTTDSGRFRLLNLAPGRYWIKVADEGYVTNDPDFDSADGPGLLVTLGPAAGVNDANLDLIPEAIISGRITDSLGNPVASESVDLTKVVPAASSTPERSSLYTEHLEPRASSTPATLPGPPMERIAMVNPDSHPQAPDVDEDVAETDETGSYRIKGLLPGRYLVSIGENVSPAGSSGGAITNGEAQVPTGVPTGMVSGDHYYSQTFYPGVESRPKAKAIEVEAGKEVTGIDFAVGKSLKAYTVSGRVLDASTGEPIQSCRLEVANKSESGTTQGRANSADGTSDTDSDGKFKISGFLSGQFLIKPDFDDDSNLYCDPLKVEIKEEDVSGIEIKARHAVTISGSISVEGDYPAGALPEPPASKIAAGWIQEGFTAPSKDSDVNPDGTFQIKGVRPGEVQIYIPMNRIQSRYLSLIRVEYTDETGQKKEVLGENQHEKFARLFEQTALPENAAGATPSAPASAQQPASAQGSVPAPVQDQTAAPSRGAFIQFVPSESVAPGALAPGATLAWIQDQMKHLIPGAVVTASVQAANNLTGVHVVLAYDNSVIRGHVNLAGRDPAVKTVIMAYASSLGHKVSGSERVNENGDYSIEGLKPGDYSVTVRAFEISGGRRNVSKTLPASVGKNAVTQLSFDIDLNAKPD